VTAAAHDARTWPLDAPFAPAGLALVTVHL
jgi:hypothetical protein